MKIRAHHSQQRGIAPVILIVIIVIIIVIIVGAIVVGSTTPSTPGPQPGGCTPAGTQCRLFIQNEMSCCGGAPVVGQRIGWCIGWWDGIPCRSGVGSNRSDSTSIAFSARVDSCTVKVPSSCSSSAPLGAVAASE